MIEYLIILITNPVFFSAGASWLLAQVLKVLILIIKNRGFSKELLTAGGGMPSSHTATVTGLVVSVLLTYGPGGFEFPMAFFFAMVVIYDSRHVRFETGMQGKMLNHIARRETARREDSFYDTVSGFDEAVGHTKAEIAAGLVLGIVTAVFSCYIVTVLQNIL